MRKIVYASAALVLQILAPTSLSACVGARAFGMGGAFVAVADDASASYWNPAALALLEERQLTGMYAKGLNYKWFGSYSQPVGENFGVAASYFSWDPIHFGYDRGDLREFHYSRPWVSFGVRLPQVTAGELAIGANLAFGRADLTRLDETYKLDVDTGVDLSGIYRVNEQWSVGLLVQDINKKEFSYEGEMVTVFNRNIRPGAAYKPNERSLLTMEIYDLTGNQYLRLGAEYWVNDNIGIRGGVYNIGGRDWPTLGASYRLSSTFSVEAAVMDFEYGIISATLSF